MTVRYVLLIQEYVIGGIKVMSEIPFDVYPPEIKEPEQYGEDE